MSVRVAVDFGTSSTCVAVSVDGHEPQVVVVDGQPLASSAVFAAPDGTLFVGLAAERQAAIDPARYEPHPKRRIDEGELLLGDTVLTVHHVVRAVLSRAVAEAARVAGGAVIDLLVLTHPAEWGAIRTQVLRQAAQGLAREVALLAEPVAAAVFHAAAYPPAHGVDAGVSLAVLDLGGGTVDASVVRRDGSTFRVLATRGDQSFGGADIDQALLEHAGNLVAGNLVAGSLGTGADPARWTTLMESRELTARRKRRALRQDVRGAKETLSRHAYTDIPLPPPFPDAHVTRADLERLIEQPLGRAVDLMLDTVREAGLTPPELLGVFLVGGSSRIPLVSQLVYQRAGVLPTTLDQPETVVARGALRAIALDPDRTGDLAAAGQAPQPPDFAGCPGYPGPAGGPAAHWPAASTAPVASPVAAGGRIRRSRVLLAAAAAVVALAVAVGTAVILRDRHDSPTREIAQYDYRFTLPGGWTQSGAAAATRRVQIRPAGAAPDTDLVVVQESTLDYDATADRARAIRDIHQNGYDRAAARGAAEGLADGVRFAGREVVHYREPGRGVLADWYVLFQGKTQVSVACQHTPGSQELVRAACDQVVRSLAILG